MKKSKNEVLLSNTIDKLRNIADEALESSVQLLNQHATFAVQMVYLLEKARKDPKNKLVRPKELVSLGEEILNQSTDLSRRSQEMQEQLMCVLDIAEQISTSERRKLMRKKWLGILAKTLSVLAMIVSVTAIILPLVGVGLSHGDEIAIGVGSAVLKVGSKVCDLAKGGKCSTDLSLIIESHTAFILKMRKSKSGSKGAFTSWSKGYLQT